MRECACNAWLVRISILVVKRTTDVYLDEESSARCKTTRARTRALLIVSRSDRASSSPPSSVIISTIRGGGSDSAFIEFSFHNARLKRVVHTLAGSSMQRSSINRDRSREARKRGKRRARRRSDFPTFLSRVRLFPFNRDVPDYPDPVHLSLPPFFPSSPIIRLSRVASFLSLSTCLFFLFYVTRQSHWESSKKQRLSGQIFAWSTRTNGDIPLEFTRGSALRVASAARSIDPVPVRSYRVHTRLPSSRRGHRATRVHGRRTRIRVCSPTFSERGDFASRESRRVTAIAAGVIQ